MLSTRRHQGCRRPADPRSVLGWACLVAMLGLLVVSCDGQTTPTTPTSTASTPTLSPTPPVSGPPPDCRAVSCAISGAIDGHSVRSYRLELTAAGRIYLRVRSSALPYILMGAYFCRGASCFTGFEDVGFNPVFVMADYELRVGDVVDVSLSNPTASAASFVLDFELDAGDAPPICVPTPRTPAPGAVFDNGRTDHRDGYVWDFSWNECPGATDYDIEVARAGAGFGSLVANGVSGSSHRVVSCGYFPDVNRLGWSWRVRAHAGARFGEWSGARPFDVERADSDPISAQCP